MLNDIKKKFLDLMIYIMILYDNFFKVVCNNKNQYKNLIYLILCCKNIIYMYMYYKVIKKICKLLIQICKCLEYFIDIYNLIRIVNKMGSYILI